MIEYYKKNIIQKYDKLSVQVKASFWFLICSFAQKGVQVVTTPIFTRLLNTAEYGKYSVFSSWMGIATIFISLNLSAGVYAQGLVKFDKEEKIFSSSMQGLTFTLVTIWAVIYICLQDFFNGLFALSSVQVIAMFIMIWTTSVFGFWATEQKVHLRYKKLVITSLLISIAKPIVQIVFVLCIEDKVSAYIWGMTVVDIVGYSWMMFSQMHNGKVFFSKKYWVYALKFNIPLIPHYLSLIILSSSDRIMIEKLVHSDAAGIYSLAYSISLIMSLFNSALMQTLSPWIYQKIKNKKVADLAPIAYTSLVLIATVNILLIALAPEAVAIFAPEAYYDAIWIIPPVAMSVFFTFCYDLFAKIEFYFEKTYFITTASVIGAVLNILLNYIFIPLFGYYAAGYTTLFCYIVYALGHYCFMRKVCNDNLGGVKVYNLKIILTISIGFMIMSFTLLLTYNVRWIRYGSVILLALIGVYFRRKIAEEIRGILIIKNK